MLPLPVRRADIPGHRRPRRSVWSYILHPVPQIHTSGRQIYLLIVLSFTALVSVSWVSEFCDPVNLLLRGEQSQPNANEAWAETFWLLLVMFMLLVASRIVMARIRYLEGLLHMCSFCKSISLNGEWIPFEQYLQEHSDLVLSHSLCPDCACEHYGYCHAEQAEDVARDAREKQDVPPRP